MSELGDRLSYAWERTASNAEHTSDHWLPEMATAGLGYLGGFSGLQWGLGVLGIVMGGYNALFGSGASGKIGGLLTLGLGAGLIYGPDVESFVDSFMESADHVVDDSSTPQPAPSMTVPIT